MTEHLWEVSPRMTDPASVRDLLTRCALCGATSIHMSGEHKTRMVLAATGAVSEWIPCPATCEETRELLLAHEVMRA